MKLLSFLKHSHSRWLSIFLCMLLTLGGISFSMSQPLNNIASEPTFENVKFPDFLQGNYSVSSNKSNYYDKFRIGDQQVELFKEGQQLVEHYMLYSLNDNTTFALEMLLNSNEPYDRTINKDRFIFNVFVSYFDETYTNLKLKVVHPNGFEEILTLIRI